MNLAKRLVHRAFCESGLHYRNPQLPCICVIPGGLKIGSRIIIQGSITAEATGFRINLQRGSDEEISDIHLQMKTEFIDSTPPSSSLQLNTRHKDIWDEAEIINPSPYKRFGHRKESHGYFIANIQCSIDGYEIDVNGGAVINYEHKDDFHFSKVTHVLIKGDIYIHSLHILSDEDDNGLPRHLRISVPSHANIGDIYHFRGRIDEDAKRFNINLQSGPGKFDDIGFHLSTEFDNSNQVIQNTRCDEVWGTERRFRMDESIFAGATIDVHVLVDHGSYKWKMNDGNQRILENDSPPSNFGTILIEGDMTMDRILISSPLITYLDDVGHVAKLSGKEVHFYGPHVPWKTELPCPFQDISALLISINGFKGSNRFDAVLQQESESRNDDKLQIEIESDENGDKTLVTKLRKDGTWKNLNKHDVNILLSVDHDFDLMLVNKMSEIQVIINGHFQIAVKNMPPGLTHFTVPKDTQIGRILIYL